MISVEDCIAMSGLTPDEVQAIAEHEHCGEASAAALGHYLLHQPRGAEAIRDMIVDDIRDALQAGRRARAAELFRALRVFLKDHPDAAVTAH